MSGQPVQGGDILADITAILARAARVDPSAISRDSRLRYDLGIDSLEMIDLAAAAEDRFGIRVPDEDVERFETVGDVVDFICQAKTAA